MDFKKLKLYFAAIVAATIMTGCSDTDPDTEKKGGERDIAFVRNIQLTAQEEGSRLADIKWHNNRIYAALQHLDDNWTPTANSTVLELDVQGNVLRRFESNFMNVGEIHIRNGNLFVVDAGSWGNDDGGITKINLVSGQATSVLSGKTPEQMIIISDNEAIVLLSQGWGDSYAARLDLNSGNVGQALGAINPVSSISLNASANALWIAAAIPHVTEENKVYKFSLTSNAVVSETLSKLPAYSIASAGQVTLVVESDFTAGHYGLIFDTGSGTDYRPQDVIDADAVARFVDGNFFILERTGSGSLIFMANDGKIIRQLPFDAAFFNPGGITGDGNGSIFVGAQEDLTIAVFSVSTK